MVRPKRRKSKQAGFTITELLVVVVIIAISAALAMPAISASSGDRRVREAASDVVHMSRRARAEAAAYGRAYLLRYRRTDGAGAIWTTYRGPSSSCNGVDWTAVFATDPCVNGVAPADGLCVEELNTNRSPYSSGNTRIKMAEITGRTEVQICYQPNGTTMFRVGLALPSGRFTERNTTSGGENFQGGIRFEVGRTESGTLSGVKRAIVFPLGAEARIVQ